MRRKNKRALADYKEPKVPFWTKSMENIWYIYRFVAESGRRLVQRVNWKAGKRKFWKFY